MSEKLFGESGRWPDSEGFHKKDGEMRMGTLQEAKEYSARRRGRKRWRGAVIALAAVVVFCTTYALILPAITMGQETFCGKEEHIHGENCYEMQLRCGREYEEERPEGHIHGEDCYEKETVLTCGLEEREDTYHAHTDACFDEEGTLVCEEPEVLEGHTHLEDCYEEEWVLACEEPEQEEALQAHEHTQDCYARVFVCTKQEHTHGISCYSDPSADLETAAEWEATLPALHGKTLGENVALVAKSQVGYTQSERNYEVDNAGGRHGYTRYGAWYGDPYGAWCAMFASFCLHYAGVERSEVPYASGCAYWVDALCEAGLYQSAGSYTPKTGDLVFFDPDGDGVSEHVGIVTGVRGETIETVEGNVGGAVAEKEHLLADADVSGFGVLPEEEELPDASTPDDQEPENPDEERPDEADAAEEPEQNGQEPELTCGLEEHEHVYSCYDDAGELVCDMEEHLHTQSCYAAEDGEDAPRYTDEELEAFLSGFTQDVEALEALEELADEDVQTAQALLDGLEQAYGDGQLSDDDFTALYERVQALLLDVYDTLAEPGSALNMILLRESGWFDAYSGASYGGQEDTALYAADEMARAAEGAPSDVQVRSPGGKNERDGVSVSKTISGTELENVFDITLQVQTPLTAGTEYQESDAAVVIVMDISNTMTYGFGNRDSRPSRYEVAMDAAEAFLDQFQKSSVFGLSKIGYVAFNTDAHKIFDLQSCTDEQTLADLKRTMRTKTGKIITEKDSEQKDYDVSHKRFTNIEAGLKMGQDMLAKAANKNKYIIFLSDGFPTTYIQSGYTGYDPYCTGGTPGQDGVFYDSEVGKYCAIGTSYSDKAARRAGAMAAGIKNQGTKIFSIGVDVGGQTIKNYVNARPSTANWSLVDRDGTQYAIGGYSNAQAYKNWLGSTIGSGYQDYYYDSSDAGGLGAAYDEILNTIKKSITIGDEADWVASDPMPVGSGLGMVEFIGLYDKSGSGYPDALSGESAEGGENTASFRESENAIDWDLKQSGYSAERSGETTTYLYTLRYRVRLRNEAEGFRTSEIYETNGETTLRYRTVKTVDGEVTASEPKELEFPIPSVAGYLGELTFVKTDNHGKALAGAEFTLTHSAKCSICRGDGTPVLQVAEMTAVSEADGRVRFTGIASGHTYLLKETRAPDGYSRWEESCLVTVSYGETAAKVLDFYQKENGQTWACDGTDTVVNSTYYALPNTGGSGTMWFTVGGLALAFTAGRGLYQIKRGRRKEDSNAS